MSYAMSTRNPSKVDVRQDCTEFQMHKTMHPLFDQVKKKLIDFTEHRLLKYHASIVDSQQKAVLIDVIDKYRKGMIAVAWKKGRAIWIDLTKER